MPPKEVRPICPAGDRRRYGWTVCQKAVSIAQSPIFVFTQKRRKAMETKLIVTYVICDDVVKKLKIKEDRQTKMTMAEIMTTAIVAAEQYSGNFEKARFWLKSSSAIPSMLSKSQFNRRLHRIKKGVWNTVLESLALEFARYNFDDEFIVDSFPIYACKLARQGQTSLYRDRKFLGYCAAKKEFFIGLKLHLISDVNANPMKISLRPASESDIRSFRLLELDLPANSVILADKAYNDYRYEDRLIQEKQIYLMPIRKVNSKRRGSKFLENVRKKKRRMIETLFSGIERLMPRSIHAVTISGLILKATLFVLAYAFNKYAVPPSEASFDTPTTSALRTSGVVMQNFV
jgi:hypothetical protein